ncbi:MAG: lamin tail domain-containing protein [Candidatus Halalkalibacterium sp. M3_1C_030]
MSFVLSLLVAVSPVLCSAQSVDSKTLQPQSNPSDSEIASSNEHEAFSNTLTQENRFKSTVDKQPVNPVIAFSIESLSVKENAGTVMINVELKEGNNSRVEVDLAFLQEISTASLTDISDYRTQTITFSETDLPGTVKSVRLSIADDNEYEQNEEAVFTLRNITEGSISEPSVFNLIIRDDDTPDIVINEIFANPVEGYGDANGDGRANASEDQFIELVNNEGEPVDISGWTLSDNFGLRFTFPKGTVLPAGTGAVVFGGGTPTGNFGGARVFTADVLGLDKSGDILILRDGQNNIVEEVDYKLQASQEQSSLTRTVDITGNLTMSHTEATETGNKLFSPGTKTDGTSFGAKYAMRLDGNEGWRLISSPTKNTTFEDLFGKFQMKTAAGTNRVSQGATIYEWNNGSFMPIEDLNEEMQPGKGYAVYFFEDDAPDLPGIQGGFPKMVLTDLPDNDNSVSVPISFSDSDGSETLSGSEGWNLLGNPYGREISVKELLSSFSRALQIEDPDLQLNNNIYIWDPEANGGNGEYIALEENNDHTVQPFQAFWVRVNKIVNSGQFTVNANLERDKLLVNNSRLFKESNSREFGFILNISDGVYFDNYQIAFKREGSIDTDRYDAFKLQSLNKNSISLYSLAGESRLMKNVLPTDLSGTLEIPLNFDAAGRESLTLDWTGLSDLPDSWNLLLLDKKLGKEINLRSVDNYRFTIAEEDKRSSLNDNKQEPVLKTQSKQVEEPRFTLTVSPGSSMQSNAPDIPESVKLNPNYPNPFNPATTISYELKEDSEVLLSIWNIVGQKVVTLVDGMQEAGEHTATWNASEMPSGIYIAQLEVGGQVFIRKMTLIK